MMSISPDAGHAPYELYRGTILSAATGSERESSVSSRSDEHSREGRTQHVRVLSFC